MSDTTNSNTEDEPGVLALLADHERPAALLAVYDGIPGAVVQSVEHERLALAHDVMQHLASIRNHLAPYGCFKAWCAAVGLNYNSVYDKLQRIEGKRLVQVQSYPPIVETTTVSPLSGTKRPVEAQPPTHYIDVVTTTEPWPPAPAGAEVQPESGEPQGPAEPLSAIRHREKDGTWRYLTKTEEQALYVKWEDEHKATGTETVLSILESHVHRWNAPDGHPTHGYINFPEPDLIGWATPEQRQRFRVVAARMRDFADMLDAAFAESEPPQ